MTFETHSTGPFGLDPVLGLLRLISNAQEQSSLSGALRSVTEMAKMLTASEVAAVFVADDVTGMLRMVGSSGLEAASPEHSGVIALRSIPWAAGRDTKVILRGEADNELAGVPRAFREGSFWAPLVHQGVTIGRLAVTSRNGTAPTAEQMEYLRLLGAYATMLVVNSRLHDSLSQRIAALTTLYEVGQTLTSTLDLDHVLRLIVDSVANLSGASACSIMLLDERREELRVRMSVGMPEEIARTACRKMGEGFSGRVAQTGEPIFLRDVTQAADLRGCNPSRYKSPSLIVVPLKARGIVIGVLNCNDKKGGDFSAEDMNLITLFAHQAAIAIDNARMHVELWKTSVTDGLTQTYVHAFFEEQLNKRVDTVKARAGTVAVIMIDLDHFKQVNDQHGHQAGDIVLQGVAALLRRAVRSGDIVARYGGEEFVLVLSDVPHRVVMSVAERLRRAVEASTFVSGEANIKVTASFGVSMLPTDVNDAQPLVKLADDNLYLSKHAGRNRVTCTDAVRAVIAAEPAVPRA